MQEKNQAVDNKLKMSDMRENKFHLVLKLSNGFDRLEQMLKQQTNRQGPTSVGYATCAIRYDIVLSLW